MLFGPQNAGKTSLMRTTCLGYNFMKVLNLKPTKGISRENFIFRGIMELNVWDAGGQEHYMERYFSETQRELIFSEVTTAIFMAESTVIEDRVKEIFEKFSKYLFEFSPHTEMIYVLLNKIESLKKQYDEIIQSDLKIYYCCIKNVKFWNKFRHEINFQYNYLKKRELIFLRI